MEIAKDGGRSMDLGSSDQVENVQALAASGPDRLTAEKLQKYIRPETEDDLLRDGDSDAIPIIDFNRLLDPRYEEEEASKLRFACEEWGFFQLINHGLPEDVIEEMKANAQEFFQLPLEEKKAVMQLPGDLEGYGQAFVVSEDQKLDWIDMLFLVSRPAHFRNLKFWPSQPATFRGALEKYSSELQQVTYCLLGSMAKILAVNTEILIDIFKDSQTMRINYYPPCSYSDKVLGLSPHTDAGGLTLLLQINEVNGLQIRRSGGWVPIKALPGAFLVNIGDALEILSNGNYKSIEHRATINTEKERLSIAAFHAPKFGSMVGPLPELVKGSKEYYKTMSTEDFLKLSLSTKLEGKSIMDHVKLKP